MLQQNWCWLVLVLNFITLIFPNLVCLRFSFTHLRACDLPLRRYLFSISILLTHTLFLHSSQKLCRIVAANRLQFQRLVLAFTCAASRRWRRHFHRGRAAAHYVAQSLPAEPLYFQHSHAHAVRRRCGAQAETFCHRSTTLQYGRAACRRRRWL